MEPTTSSEPSGRQSIRRLGLVIVAVASSFAIVSCASNVDVTGSLSGQAASTPGRNAGASETPSPLSTAPYYGVVIDGQGYMYTGVIGRAAEICQAEPQLTTAQCCEAALDVFIDYDLEKQFEQSLTTMTPQAAWDTESAVLHATAMAAIKADPTRFALAQSNAALQRISVAELVHGDVLHRWGSTMQDLKDNSLGVPTPSAAEIAQALPNQVTDSLTIARMRFRDYDTAVAKRAEMLSLVDAALPDIVFASDAQAFLAAQQGVDADGVVENHRFRTAPDPIESGVRHVAPGEPVPAYVAAIVDLVPGVGGTGVVEDGASSYLLYVVLEWRDDLISGVSRDEVVRDIMDRRRATRLRSQLLKLRAEATIDIMVDCRNVAIPTLQSFPSPTDEP